MKTLFDREGYDEIIRRIISLQPGTTRQWGKMSVNQMLAHCCTTMEVACGIRNIPRMLIGRLIGGFLKKRYVSDIPFSKNSPTHPTFVIADEREFETEKQKLLGLVQRFFEGGESDCTRQPHSFFGHLTPAEWGVSQYKHLDHHLRQFSA